jgi:hypothetical protein
MMRAARMRAVLLAIAASLALSSCAPERASTREAVRPAANISIESARELDQQGVRAFRAGRYADAERYFRTSFTLGGPSSELWNIARARERLDD